MLTARKNFHALTALIHSMCMTAQVPRERWEQVLDFVYQNYPSFLHNPNPRPECLTVDNPILAVDSFGADRNIEGVYIEILDLTFLEILEYCISYTDASITTELVNQIYHDMEGVCDSAGYDIIIRHSRCKKRFNLDHQDMMYGQPGYRRRERFKKQFAEWCARGGDY